MRKTENIPRTVRRLLSDYTGGSMDPIWSEIIDTIENELIGKNESVKDRKLEYETAQAIALRNAIRQRQREALRYESMDKFTARGAIALVLDDYRISVTTQDDDLIKATSLDSTVELIISAIESYILPKGRDIVSSRDGSEMMLALVPLFSQQLASLGADIDTITGGEK